MHRWLRNWWIGLWGDLHQIHAFFLSDPQRVIRGHDAQLLAVAADQPHFLVADVLIQLMRYCANNRDTSFNILPSGARNKPAPRPSKHARKKSRAPSAPATT